MLGIVAFISAAGLGAKYYYDSTQTKIETLTKANTILDGVVTTQNATIDNINENAEAQQFLVLELQADLQDAEAVTDNLRRILNEHDLTRLVLAKPGLIETRINNATQELFDNIESSTSND